MKKNMIAGIALALGMISVGAVSASAAGSCCGGGKCSDKQVVQQFTQETAGLTAALNSRNLELAQLYSENSIDVRRVDIVEAEIKALKTQIKVAAEKFSIPSCCLG